MGLAMDLRFKMAQSKSLYQQIQYHVLPSLKMICLMTMHDIIDKYNPTEMGKN
jgi:hypothetical protein